MKEKIEEFIRKKKLKEIKRIAEQYPEKKSLNIDFQELEKHAVEIAEELILNPDDVFAIFYEAIRELNIPLSENLTFGQDRAKLNVRVFNLPNVPGYTVPIRNINAESVDNFISVEGAITRLSDNKAEVSVGRFYCNKCNEAHDKQQSPSSGSLQEPLFCNNCKRRKFRFEPNRKETIWIDAQRLEIQEPLEMLRGGEQARTIEVWAEDDLIDLATPGDKIIVTGVVRLLPSKQGSKTYHKFLEANHIEKTESAFEDIEITPEDEKEIKKLSKDPNCHDKIIQSIAPTIYGYYEIKEGIVLQLFGGTHHPPQKDGTRERPDIHLLLVGDPGIAKSKLLEYVNILAPKSIYVSGGSTSGAGLTCTAEKNEFREGAWSIKAGALILAGGGLLLIDEFDKMDEKERGQAHEAMEQGTVSVAKAGIVTSFRANPSILAAANPKWGRFDTYKPLPEQFDIPIALLTRFDLCFPMRDIVDTVRDDNIAEHLVLKKRKLEEREKKTEAEIPTELLRKYIAYAKININPHFSEDAEEKLRGCYSELRQQSRGGSVSATPRQLEGLIRLAEASAKARLSDVATVNDVDRAMKLLTFSLKETAYDPETGKIDIDIIQTGHPTSFRDKIHLMENLIRELVAKSPDELVDIEEIRATASSKHNLDNETIEKILDEFKTKGIIYEPRHGRFTFTEG